jgi:hypothetical protein
MFYLLAARIADRIADEHDRTIAAFATAQSPKGLEAWAERMQKRSPDDSRAAANAHTLSTLSRLFPDRVRVN